MKKVIALVLTLAMLVSCFAFSASAATDPALVIEGASNVEVGDDYTVSIRLNDENNAVGGFQGALKYTNATVKEIAVNPQVLGYNKTDENGAETVIKDDKNGTIKFATVADIDGTNPATRIWFKVTFTVAAADPTFALDGVTFSGKDAKALDGAKGADLAPITPSTEEDAASTSIENVGILDDVIEPQKQAIVVKAAINNGEKVDELGVLFYPYSLLDGDELTVNTEGAVKASLVKDGPGFADLTAAGEYVALLKFDFDTEAKAARFMGTRVVSRVYYKIGDQVFYSANTVGNYVKNGVANMAVLNKVLEVGDKAAEAGAVGADAYNAAKADLDGDNYVANRKAVLKFAVENA